MIEKRMLFVSGGQGFWRTWAELWRGAGWSSRALFSILLALFLVRAVYEPDGGCDLAGFLHIGAQALDGGLFDARSGNTYPPPFSVAMAPLAALGRLVGPRAMRHLWGLAQLAALGYLTLAFARALGLRLSLGAVALAYLCAWGHVVDDLNNQNLSLLLWALVAWALLRVAEGRVARGAAALAVGATLKIMPGFPLVALVAPGAPRRARAVAGAAAGLAGSAAVTLLALRADLLEEVRYWLTHTVSRGAALQWGAGNRGWVGLALRLSSSAGDGAQRLAVLWGHGIGLAMLAALAALFFARPARTARVVALDALLATIAGVLALPIVWSHYLTLCIPVALAVCASFGELARWERRCAAGALAAGAVLSCFFNVDLVGPGVWRAADRYGSTLWGTLLILAAGALLRRAWQRAAASAPAAEGGDASGRDAQPVAILRRLG